MSDSDIICTKDTCPAEWSIQGYAPSLEWNALFIGLFGVSAIVHIAQGIKYKKWSFMIAMGLGALQESAGYGGRIMLHNNPFDFDGFRLQIVLLTLAPAFFSAGIYLQLKHIVITFGPSISRLRPAWYTYIFITCDVVSIALQGAGGGLASAASGPGPLMDTGNNLMMTGLAFQVFTLLIFATLAAEFFLRVKRRREEMNKDCATLRQSTKFKVFLGALVVAYSAILIRCIYRIAEMAGGWGNEIMRHELSFMILDPLMCIIAAGVLNAAHPGLCFQNRGSVDSETASETTGVQTEMAHAK